MGSCYDEDYRKAHHLRLTKAAKIYEELHL